MLPHGTTRTTFQYTTTTVTSTCSSIRDSNSVLLSSVSSVASNFNLFTMLSGSGSGWNDLHRWSLRGWAGGVCATLRGEVAVTLAHFAFCANEFCGFGSKENFLRFSLLCCTKNLSCAFASSTCTCAVGLSFGKALWTHPRISAGPLLHCESTGDRSRVFFFFGLTDLRVVWRGNHLLSLYSNKRQYCFM